MSSKAIAQGRIDVNVDLGEKSYPIHIGENLLELSGELISAKLPDAKCVIISDDNVAALHLETLHKSP